MVGHVKEYRTGHRGVELQFRIASETAAARCEVIIEAGLRERPSAVSGSASRRAIAQSVRNIDDSVKKSARDESSRNGFHRNGLPGRDVDDVIVFVRTVG